MKNYTITALIACLFLLPGCQDDPEGYISDLIQYEERVVTVDRGIARVTTPLRLDNSTQPIRVKLLEVRDEATGAPVDYFAQEYEVGVWVQKFDVQTDVTLDDLMRKYVMRSLPVLTVNELSGRLELTEATAYIPEGRYVIDVGVSNSAGSRVLREACTMNLISPTKFISALPVHFCYATTPGAIGWPANEMKELTEPEEIEAMIAEIPDYNPACGYVKYKYYDVSSTFGGPRVYFNPKQGEIVPVIGRSGIEDSSPWFDPIYTDDGIIIPFPIVPYPTVDPFYSPQLPLPQDFMFRNRIPGQYVNVGEDIWVHQGVRIFIKGLYEVEMQINRCDWGGGDENWIRRVAP